MRLIKGSAQYIASPTFVGADGEEPVNCSGAPTCTVTRANGTALTAADVDQPDDNDLGNYRAFITSTHTAQCDTLAVVWTGAPVVGSTTLTQVYRTTIDVVGSHFLTIPEIRNYEDLADSETYPTQMLADMRDELEDYLEEICNVSFVRRHAIDRLDGTSCREIQLTNRFPLALISVTINGTAVADLTKFTLYESGKLDYYGGVFSAPTSTPRNVVVEYEYGDESPPPKLKRECLKAVRREALAEKSGLSPDVIANTFEGQTLRYSTPNIAEGRPTGILSLDPVLNQYTEPIACL